MTELAKACRTGQHTACGEDGCQCKCHATTHKMTVEMRNLCGMKTLDPRGHRATNMLSEVTCPACLAALGIES